jgi:hypothetical protein
MRQTLSVMPIAGIIAAFFCAVTPVAHADSPFDGTYKGTSSTVGAVSPSCHEYGLTIVVTNAHFETNILSRQFSVDVGGDGAFSATAYGAHGAGQVTGRIADGVLQMDYGSPDCRHHATLQRR